MYCGLGVSEPLPCAAGRFGSTPGLTNRECTGACLKGHYCNAGSSSNTSGVCPKGRFNSEKGGTSLGDACALSPRGMFAPTEAATRAIECDGGYHQPAFGQAQCSPCAEGTFQADTGAADCLPCEVGRFSTAGAAQCAICAPGYYRPHAGSSADDCTSCDAIEGVTCGVNSTVDTLNVTSGFWRHATATTKTYECTTKEGWSSCRGGANAGNDGLGYCAAGYHGPKCEICDNDDAGPKVYFDGADARCHDCPDASVPALILVGILMVFVFLCYFMYVLLTRPPKSLEAASRVFATFLSVLQDIGPSKLKSAITFYQIIMSFPASFGLEPVHFNLRLMIEMFSFFSFDWSEVAYPTGCLIGGYVVRLLTVSLFPFAVIVLVPFTMMIIITIVTALGLAGNNSSQNSVVVAMEALTMSGRASFSSSGDALPQVDTPPRAAAPPAAATTRESRKKSLTRSLSSRKFSLTSPTREMANAATQRAATAATRISKWNQRLLAVLPLVVFVIFLFVPSVSRTIFFTWACVPFEVGPGPPVQYLRRDLSVICQSDDHNTMVALAIGLVFLWPIGMQLLLFMTLWVNRKDLRAGTDNKYSQATRFLTGGYKPDFFYWEIVELFRRVTCSGFVILIPYEYIFMRVLVAFAISLPILVMTAVLKPFKNPEDTALALVSQTILICAFATCGVIRVVISEAVDGETKVELFGFKDEAGLFLLLGIICLIFFLMLLGVYCYKINDLFQKRVRQRGDLEAEASSKWILAGAVFMGVTALGGFGVVYGIVGALIGGGAFFPFGGGLGATIYFRCIAPKKKPQADASTTKDPMRISYDSCAV
mmetsp:Transcript_63054/g.167882  ORF Transcript_63054/g.167882 Transcript_63054/m.167882 type:complete len:825 (-) Transcript_63054:585-3059(-)